MNILYCILHTQKQESRAHNILSTWGKDQNILFYSDHEDKTINCHKVAEQSDYGSGQIKQINIFSLLLTNFNHYDWYFFCDNDTFVNTSKLNDFVRTANINCVHGDIINSWPQDKSLYYPSGGAGYLLSKSILSRMNNLHYNDTQYSDVSIGINLKEMSIPLAHHNLFKGHTPEHFGITDNYINQYITFHYIVEQQNMLKLHTLVNNNDNR